MFRLHSTYRGLCNDPSESCPVVQAHAWNARRLAPLRFSRRAPPPVSAVRLSAPTAARRGRRSHHHSHTESGTSAAPRPTPAALHRPRPACRRSVHDRDQQVGAGSTPKTALPSHWTRSTRSTSRSAGEVTQLETVQAVVAYGRTCSAATKRAPARTSPPRSKRPVDRAQPAGLRTPRSARQPDDKSRNEISVGGQNPRYKRHPR